MIVVTVPRSQSPYGAKRFATNPEAICVAITGDWVAIPLRGYVVCNFWRP